MPPLPPAENVLRVVPRFRMHGEDVMNVHHFLMPQGKSLATMAELAVAFRNAWQAGARAQLSNEISLVDITVTDLSAAALATHTEPVTTSNAGTTTNPALPSNNAMVVSLRTALRGRSYRGRIYVAGIPEMSVTGNNLLQTFVDGVRGTYASLVSVTLPTSGAVAQLCVLSYWQAGALRAAPAATPVTSVLANSRVDSQRRRLPRR